MKPWMKIIMWLGLGFGIGFFAGEQVGEHRAEKEKPEQPEVSAELYVGPARDAMEEYRGGDTDGDEVLTGYVPGFEPADDDPDMPTEEDIQIDPEIPQLHPQHLVPEIIGEEEYNANIWNYDLENLLFYEMDEVLYNETTQTIIENPEDVIGHGTLFEFGGDPNNPVDTIFVKNDTYGVLFRIDRIDAAFCDAVDGSFPPDEDD